MPYRFEIRRAMEENASEYLFDDKKNSKKKQNTE